LKKVKAKDYPSANTVTVLNDQAVVYQLDGQFSNTQHVARLVLTPTGKTDAASSSLYYAKDAEKMEVLGAQVIKADGKVIPVDQKSIQDVEQSGEANIYDPNGRAMKVTFPNLQVGDVVDMTYKLTRLTPTRMNYFNDIFGFQSTEPMLEASYVVDGPATMPLTSQLYHAERGGKISESKSKVGDRMHYAWSVKNAPQLVPEAAMDFTTETPMLVVTTDPSWQHFSQWWAKLTEPLPALVETGSTDGGPGSPGSGGGLVGNRPADQEPTGRPIDIALYQRNNSNEGNVRNEQEKHRPGA